MSAVEKEQVLQGLTNADWQKRKVAAMARGQGNIAPVYIDRAKNAELWDVEGNRYIDFGTGIAVCNTGHSNPKVVAAVQTQLEKFSHTCVMVTPYDTAVRLAEELNELVPGIARVTLPLTLILVGVVVVVAGLTSDRNGGGT